MTNEGFDSELKAIQSIISVLEPLDENARLRAINYVLQRFDISRIDVQGRRVQISQIQRGLEEESIQKDVSIDIRTLREQKSPETAIEMAVLVGYYLSEHAQIEERKSTVNTNDLKKYFKQAKFPLPKSLPDVLPNAKKAGYIETVSRGEYRLNSVGYNFAVHGLPRKKKD